MWHLSGRSGSIGCSERRSREFTSCSSAPYLVGERNRRACIAGVRYEVLIDVAEADGAVADLSGLAVFFASDVSAYMIGSDNMIDVGHTVWWILDNSSSRRVVERPPYSVATVDDVVGAGHVGGGLRGKVDCEAAEIGERSVRSIVHTCQLVHVSITSQLPRFVRLTLVYLHVELLESLAKVLRRLSQRHPMSNARRPPNSLSSQVSFRAVLHSFRTHNRANSAHCYIFQCRLLVSPRSLGHPDFTRTYHHNVP